MENCTSSAAWYSILESSEKKALERNSVDPAVLNLRRPGGVVAGNSLGEALNPEKVIQRVRRTLCQYVIPNGLSAPLREITLCTQWDDKAAHT